MRYWIDWCGSNIGRVSTFTRQMQDLTVHHHTLTVPLVWDDDADSRTLNIHAAEVTREGGENLPYLVFLQGGPGQIGRAHV